MDHIVDLAWTASSIWFGLSINLVTNQLCSVLKSPTHNQANQVFRTKSIYSPRKKEEEEEKLGLVLLEPLIPDLKPGPHISGQVRFRFLHNHGAGCSPKPVLLVMLCYIWLLKVFSCNIAGLEEISIMEKVGRETMSISLSTLFDCHKFALFYWAFHREVFGPYSVEVRNLGLRILDLICEGLGIESGYFRGPLSEGQLMVVNHYPPCPDPTLVLGLPKHGDPHLITLLNQGDVPGLQVWKDEQWVMVEPIPNAFVVNINHKLQIISNGKLRSAYHRVVTSSNVARTTVAGFVLPSKDTLIEPAKSLVTELRPPLYKSFISGDFDSIYTNHTHEGKDPLEHLMIRS